MHKRVSPAQAARRVLKAFPYAHPDAEVSSAHIADYFRRHGFPVSDMVAGVHYAASAGWVQRTDIHSLKLTLSGVEALDSHHPSIPPSTWHTWTHP